MKYAGSQETSFPRKRLSRAQLDQRQQREELRLAQERYQSLFENAVEGIYRATPEGRLATANPALAHLLGCETFAQLQQYVALTEQNYVNPQRREAFLRQLQERDRVIGFEYEVHKRTGDTVWISENAWAVRDSGGNAALLRRDAARHH